MKFDDHDMPASNCTACGERLDTATTLDRGDKPEPNDMTICLSCGHLMAFADDLTLRELTNTEIRKAAGDKRILAIQRARGAIMSEK